jgi:hypothetical protein
MGEQRDVATVDGAVYRYPVWGIRLLLAPVAAVVAALLFAAGAAGSVAGVVVWVAVAVTLALIVTRAHKVAVRITSTDLHRVGLFRTRSVRCERVCAVSFGSSRNRFGQSEDFVVLWEDAPRTRLDAVREKFLLWQLYPEEQEALARNRQVVDRCRPVAVTLSGLPEQAVEHLRSVLGAPAH